MLGVEPDKSLFEILCDNLKTAKINYNVYIPWYIMTSRENNAQTIAFFEKNNYFNYPKEKIKFFSKSLVENIEYFCSRRTTNGENGRKNFIK